MAATSASVVARAPLLLNKRADSDKIASRFAVCCAVLSKGEPLPWGVFIVVFSGKVGAHITMGSIN